jgi:choline dehydrogenase
MLSTYDNTVIGGGSARSFVAERLSESDATVPLLEAGPVTPPDDLYPSESFPTRLLGSAIDWSYSTVAQAGTANNVHVWPRGKVLGGASAINAMGHIRGHRANYDGWAAGGASGWSYDDLLPHFRRSETAPGRDPAFRGTDGPLLVAPPKSKTLGTQAFYGAVIETGHPFSIDINARDQVETFLFDLNCVEGRRQSAADACLRPVMDRVNLDVIGDALVHRIHVERGRSVAVEFSAGKALATVRVEREAVLTAGVIGSLNNCFCPEKVRRPSFADSASPSPLISPGWGRIWAG